MYLDAFLSERLEAGTQPVRGSSTNGESERTLGRLMQKLMVSDCIWWICDVCFEHLMGVRIQTALS